MANDGISSSDFSVTLSMALVKQNFDISVFFLFLLVLLSDPKICRHEHIIAVTSRIL